jgi:ABC-2 type transport system permease protein
MRQKLRTVKVAAWLGWQIEANWASPWLFIGYSTLKPMSASLILVAMYFVVVGADTSSVRFAYMFVGNSFYAYVFACLTGLSSSIIQDRERYQMLRYIYLAPISPLAYMFGRAVPVVAGATVAVAVNLLLGASFFGIRLLPAEPQLFVGSMLLGLVAVMGLGVMASGLAIVVARHSYFLGEALAGSLYLLSGAVFPVDVLPGPVAGVASVMPVALWLEGLRRSFGIYGASKIMASFSTAQILMLLSVSALGLGLMSLLVYRWCEARAREKGMLDSLTNY